MRLHHPLSTFLEGAVEPPPPVNFVQGDTLTQSVVPPPSGLADPLFPPVARLTKESAPGSRYQLGRLQEPSLLESIRLYLAYLHDKPTDVCISGKTRASIRLRLATEGLSARREELLNLYRQFYLSYGLSEADVDSDLNALRNLTQTERMAYLQRARETQYKYTRPI
ncbi:unnamed protein product [Acanthoscelides obtectus]|uniref:Uncharacterized protein n=1 Tax=Acanthoscelides obtectus TaxID=200917 RepID=A0A9P0LKJ3_ACAOB|nr:unnamed protein product [Acanthoscelides obtectus]CAK1682258.1 hypothetical protein AOBTE_LOCUS33515 [Acanthoscelides obtectus]